MLEQQTLWETKEDRAFALEEVNAKFPKLKSEPRLAPVVTRSWLEQTWGLLYMRTQPNRDLSKLADFLRVEIGDARRIIERNDELCLRSSAASGRELHATISVNLETEGGVQIVRYPRRPVGKAMQVAEQIGMEIKRMMDEPGNEQAQMLDFWSRNLVPQWTSALFHSRKSSDGSWLAAPETLRIVDEFLRFLNRLGLTQAQLSFKGACEKNREFVPTSWYGQWGLFPRPTCKIRNYFGKRAKQIADGQWLSIGPKRACDGDKNFSSSYHNGFRFAMLLASIRFGFSPDNQRGADLNNGPD